jgi:hypothetical protein
MLGNLSMACNKNVAASVALPFYKSEREEEINFNIQL